MVSSRHRLLRRGRSYGRPLHAAFEPDEIMRCPDEAKPERGLHFICFNTDISRQFEFVQGTWMNNPKFDGLYGDPDALISPHQPPPAKRAEEAGRFTMQGELVRERLTGLKQFVTTVGGCYLFMPGFRAMRYLVADRHEVR